jgi:hypothetical protein
MRPERRALPAHGPHGTLDGLGHTHPGALGAGRRHSASSTKTSSAGQLSGQCIDFLLRVGSALRIIPISSFLSIFLKLDEAAPVRFASLMVDQDVRSVQSRRMKVACGESGST